MKYIWSIILGLALLAGVSGWWFLSYINSPVGTSAEKVTIVVSKGEGVRAIGDILYTNKLIRARWEWNLYIVLTGRRSSLLTGTFALNRGMSIPAIANAMSIPNLKDNEVTVKIREGLTAKQIGAILETSNVVSQQDFLAAVNTHDLGTLLPNDTYSFLSDRPASSGLEGFLFPDTYRFFLHSTPASVVKKFLDNFQVKVASDLRAESALSGRTFYDNMILASILEAELQTPGDRAMAADLFLRRISTGMFMGADTTVLYALGGTKTSLTLDDLKVDSPYNTYTHHGLPPGPIDNPGRSSIAAAIHPQANTYWYYLTATDGRTIFAKTLAEQAANKVKYLK